MRVSNCFFIMDQNQLADEVAKILQGGINDSEPAEKQEMLNNLKHHSDLVAGSVAANTDTYVTMMVMKTCEPVCVRYVPTFAKLVVEKLKELFKDELAALPDAPVPV